MQLNRKSSTCEAYQHAGKEEEALSALFEGVAYYWKYDAEYEQLGIRQEADEAYAKLLAVLKSEYAIDEESAKEIIELDSVAYTYRIRSIISGESDVTENDADDNMTEENTATEETEDTQTEENEDEVLEDLLEEEMD
jgi:hypothetical protein